VQNGTVWILSTVNNVVVHIYFALSTCVTTGCVCVNVYCHWLSFSIPLFSLYVYCNYFCDIYVNSLYCIIVVSVA